MLKILGIVLAILGFVWLIKPQGFKNFIKKKSAKKLRRWIFGLLIVLAIYLVPLAWRIPTLWLRLAVIILGLVALFKIASGLKARAVGKIAAWLEEKPILGFRIAAVVILILGVLLFKFS